MAEPRVPGDVKAALGLAGALITIATLIGDNTLGLVIGILVVPLFAYCMFRVPVRQSLLVIMFFALTLQNPAEGNPSGNLWSPPFHMVGAALLTHLNSVDRSLGALSWCSFSGLDLCFLTLGLVLLYRRSTRSKIDTAGRVPTPKPMIRLAWVALGGAAYVWLSGILRGGDVAMSLWQLNSVMYLPVVFLLFQAGLRGPQDHGALARVILTAATYKGLLATFVVRSFASKLADPVTGETFVVFGTTHADSMLFADACVLILACLLERVSGRTKWLAVCLLPIFASGMISNNRRLVWVQIALVFLTVYIVSADSPAKRFVRRGLTFAAPLIAVYLMVGWNAGSSIFKPARMLRSVVDAKSDGSSLWRELENFDLLATFQQTPIFGTGFGHPYLEVIPLPAVDYSLERYVPHNGILGLWAQSGYFGYAALTMIWAGGVYFAMRAYHTSRVPTQRAAALVSFGAVLAYIMQCWGDLGLGSWTGVFTVGAAIAVAGKLSVINGQWPGNGGTGKAKGGYAPRASSAA